MLSFGIRREKKKEKEKKERKKKERGGGMGGGGGSDLGKKKNIPEDEWENRSTREKHSVKGHFLTLAHPFGIFASNTPPLGVFRLFQGRPEDAPVQ